MWVHDGILTCCWGQEETLWNQATRPLASFVIWTGSQHLYLLVSLSLMWRDDHLCLLDLLWGLNRLVHRKHLKQHQVYISSVQFSRSVVSDSLQPHGLQHSRPPCPLPTPRVYSNSCPLSWWCHPTISSSVVPFSSCLQSFPESGSSAESEPESVLCIRWPKYWSLRFSISPSNEYSGLISFRMDWLDLLA